VVLSTLTGGDCPRFPAAAQEDAFGPGARYNHLVGTGRSVEQVWVAQWCEAGPALAEQRARELREMSEAQALAAAEALLSLALLHPLNASRLTESGLVRQQALFHRLPP
jgi:hypothetical protein